MIPPGRHGGRKRSVNVREVLNGIFYVLWTGYQWKALPKDLPPRSTCTPKKGPWLDPSGYHAGKKIKGRKRHILVDSMGFIPLMSRTVTAWISRNRRLARDFERYATTVVAFVRLAMIRIMLRRLAANTSS